MESMDLKMLGISATEARVLSALQGISRANVSEIAREMRIPRTTARFLLEKLRRREFAERIRVQNHHEWRIASNEELVRKIRQLANLFEGKIRRRSDIEDIGIGVEVYRGRKKVIESCRKLIRQKKDSKIYLIKRNNHLDIFLAPELTLIVNLQRESVVLIKNQSVVDAFQTLFHQARDIAKEADLKEYLRGLVVKS